MSAVEVSVAVARKQASPATTLKVAVAILLTGAAGNLGQELVGGDDHTVLHRGLRRIV
jgi:hypothetical protein